MRSEREARLAYVAIGANLEGPEGQVRRAIDELGQMPGARILRTSPLYLTRPLGMADQPDYVNAVVSLETCLPPRDLLLALQAIEDDHGRERRLRWGPRTLDLDILLYDGNIIDEPGLRVPHPEMAGRPFVLYPLADIAPGDLAIPGQGTLSGLLAACPRDGIQLLASPRSCEDAASLAESPPA